MEVIFIMTQEVHPLYDRVLIERASAEEKSAGGIVLPNTNEKPECGKVIAVGPGKRLENGQYASMAVKIGDTVVFSKYAGNEFKLLDKKECIIAKEEDILAIIK